MNVRDAERQVSPICATWELLRASNVGTIPRETCGQELPMMRAYKHSRRGPTHVAGALLTMGLLAIALLATALAAATASAPAVVTRARAIRTTATTQALPARLSRYVARNC